MGDFSDKRVVISGASRGIGLAIAKRLAAEVRALQILAKTAEPHPQTAGYRVYRRRGDCPSRRQGATTDYGHSK
ncbi:MAG: hypothetical protein Ct9H300mP16_18180 [Pseudomonadota bacterium]|nr:MAG: hypothetical protein Ct9H300mP16_18180 [Pseudomonadota bacterium]